MTVEINYSGYRPGALAQVLELHMKYYSRIWNFGIEFETKVAGEQAEFFSRYRPEQDLFLLALDKNSKCIGSITLDCSHEGENGVHLRWFIVDEAFSGNGIGKELLRQAISHS